MYCTSCGAQIKPDERFCVNCGTRVALTAPTIGHPVYTQPREEATDRSYGQGSDPYGQGGAPYGQSPDPYGQTTDSYGQGGAPYGQGTDSYGQSTDPLGAAGPYQSPYQRQPWGTERERASSWLLDEPEPEAEPRPNVAGAIILDLLVGVVLIGVAAGVAFLVLGQRTGMDLSEFIASRGWVDILLCGAVLIVYGLAAGALHTSVGMATMAALRGSGTAAAAGIGTGAVVLAPVFLALVAAGALGGVVGATGSGSSESGPGGDDQAANVQVSQTPTPTADPAEIAESQVMALEQVISSSAKSKANLGEALDDVSGCQRLSQALADLKSVRDGRAAQLAQARALVVSAIPDGEAIRDALVQALEYSHSADLSFVEWAENVIDSNHCVPDSAYQSGVSTSEKAQAAKRAFVELWNPVARQYGLEERTAPSI